MSMRAQEARPLPPSPGAGPARLVPKAHRRAAAGPGEVATGVVGPGDRTSHASTSQPALAGPVYSRPALRLVTGNQCVVRCHSFHIAGARQRGHSDCAKRVGGCMRVTTTFCAAKAFQ